MTRIGVEDSTTFAMDTINGHPEDEEWIRAIVTDNDDQVRRIIEEMPNESGSGKNLNNLLHLKSQGKDCYGSKKQICATSYSPDTPLCLSAMFNSHKAMEILVEYGADCLQKTSNGNNMLHILVAFASINGEEGEERTISTAEYIKNLVGDELYRQLLQAENDDGLRPLELACHLGTFGLFMYFFETPVLYIIREEDHVLHKIQYFDITEYVSGPRYLKSPIYGLTYAEEENINSNYLKDACLKDPICSWISIVLHTNLPFIVWWFINRLLYIMLFLACDPVVQDVCDNNGNCPRGTIFSVNVNLGMYYALLLMSVFMVVGDIIDFVHWLSFHPRWLYRKVYGPKTISMHHVFYRLSHFSAVLVAAISSAVTLGCHYENISPYPAMEIAVVFAVWSFVWSVLYFIQLLPMVGFYVMSVQRMLKDFINFAFLLFVFFFTYTIAFYKLLRTNETVKDFNKMPQSFYNTFRVMLNMVEFFYPDAEVGFAVYVVHVSYVFMIAILLLNFLIATMSSSYELVMSNREVLFKMHRLSVSVTVDQRFPRLLAPIRNYLRRSLFVYENDRYYVTRAIELPANSDGST